jgi:NAD(P)-dependent dehydrogenase (short-subunit alcohol dehydrogenase family)
MDVFILTGAGSEPAQSIARRLVRDGARVYGLDARFAPEGFSHADFTRVPLNLADNAAVLAAAAEILSKESGVAGLVLAARVAVPDPFEAVSPDDIAIALNAGVTAPLLLARAVLPTLVKRRGSIVAVVETTGNTAPAAAPATGGALNAAVLGALNGFSRALFDELRDTGVRASLLRLENNTGEPDPAARFTHAPQSRVQPDIVADAVEFLLRLRENNALTELTLRPQATRETPRLPVTAEPRLRVVQNVQLPPPEKFPPPEERIPTPVRRRPDYAPPPGSEPEFDAGDDDDDSVDPELRYLLRPRRGERDTGNSGEEDAAGEKDATGGAGEEGADEASETGESSAAGGREFPRRTGIYGYEPPPPEHRRGLKPPKQGIRIHPNIPTGTTGDAHATPSRPPQPPNQQNQKSQKNFAPPADGLPPVPVLDADGRPLPPQARKREIPIQNQPYPENWHWPRRPSKPQRLLLEKRRRQREWRLKNGLPVWGSKRENQQPPATGGATHAGGASGTTGGTGGASVTNEHAAPPVHERSNAPTGNAIAGNAPAGAVPAETDAVAAALAAFAAAAPVPKIVPEFVPPAPPENSSATANFPEFVPPAPPDETTAGAADETAAPAKRPRGRPPKAKSAEDAAAAPKPAPKRRGRPPKKATAG